MTRHPSWSDSVLGSSAAPELVAYSWIDRSQVPVSGRHHVLLADLAAGLESRLSGISVEQAVRKAALEMVLKGLATSDLRTWVSGNRD